MVRTIIYNRANDIIEVKIRDNTGRLIDKFRCSITNKGEYFKMMSAINNKYGYSNAEIGLDDSVYSMNQKKKNNRDNIESEKDKEINWLSMDNSFFDNDKEE